jgi:hypothetical protein
VAAPYILARTLKDAHEFARDELGLSRGRYRVVTSPSTLSGRRGTDLYLVPGHERRYDRFAMRGALRYTKLNVIDVAERAEAPPVERYPNDERTHEIALRYNTLRDSVDEHSEPDGLEPAGEQITIEDVNAFLIATGKPDAEIKELAEEPAPVDDTKRRRRRCKECGILVDPDEIEQHAAEHLPTEQ